MQITLEKFNNKCSRVSHLLELHRILGIISLVIGAIVAIIVGGRRGHGRNNNYGGGYNNYFGGGGAPQYYQRSIMGAPPTTHLSNARPESSQQSNAFLWFPNTGAMNHVTPNVAGLDHSKAYQGSDTLHIGSGRGLSIANVASKTFYRIQHFSYA